MNVVIIEDSDLIRTQLVRIINGQPRVHVVGVAGEEEAAVQMILALRPDTVLLDLSLSPGSGCVVPFCRRMSWGPHSLRHPYRHGQ